MGVILFGDVLVVWIFFDPVFSILFEAIRSCELLLCFNMCRILEFEFSFTFYLYHLGAGNCSFCAVLCNIMAVDLSVRLERFVCG